MARKQNHSSRRAAAWKNQRFNRRRNPNNGRRYRGPARQQKPVKSMTFVNSKYRNAAKGIPLGQYMKGQQQFPSNTDAPAFVPKFNKNATVNSGRAHFDQSHTPQQAAAHAAMQTSVNSASLGPASNGGNSPVFDSSVTLRGGRQARMYGGVTRQRQTKNAAVSNFNVEAVGGPQGAPVASNVHRSLGLTSTLQIAEAIIQQNCTKLARGLYSRMRTANISIGPAAQNDKYAPSTIPNPFATSQDAITTIREILYGCIDFLKKQGRLPLALPRHISFALNLLANKMVVRTLQGCLDIFPGVPITWENLNIAIPSNITYILQCMQLPAFGFPLTEEVLSESAISVYHDNTGAAITSTMKFEEIASIVGVALVDPNSNASNAVVYKLYDWNGLESPSSTTAFRCGFFCDLGSDVANLPADYDYNLVYKRNMSFNHNASQQQFAQTGVCPTLEFAYAGNTDFNFFSDKDRTDNFATSEGLNYLFDRINQVTNTDKPILTTSNPQNYNNALFLAIALQTKCNNFFLPTYNGLNPASWDYDASAEQTVNFAIAIAQFIEKIPLPSPIFEEIKNFSDFNAWTYVGRPEPVGIQWFTNMNYIKAVGGNVNNFFTQVEFNAQLMFEMRHRVRLNYAPELNGYMPSLHLFVTDGSTNKLFSILDAESLRNKDVMTFLNSSIIPKIFSSIPLAMTYVSVKNVNNAQNLSFLYQMSYDASTSGPSSELDQYYRMLRQKKIGFWGALASLAGAALPYIPKLVTTIVDAFHKKKASPTSDASDSVNSGGALINTLLQSITSHRSDGSIALNSPKTQTVLGQPKKRILKKIGKRYRRI